MPERDKLGRYVSGKGSWAPGGGGSSGGGGGSSSGGGGGGAGEMVGSGFVALNVDMSGVKSGLSSLGGMLNSFSWGNIASVGAAIVGPLIGFANSLSEWSAYSNDMDRLAKMFGLDTKTLTEMAHAAHMSDVEIGSLINGIKIMQKNLHGAESGKGGISDTFTQLGIAFQDIKDLAPEDQMMMIGDAIGKLESASDRTAASMTIFGRAGTTLIPLFLEGRENIQAFREEADRLGIVLSENKFENYERGIKRMNAAILGFKGAIAETLEPIVTPFVNRFKENLITMQAWVHHNTGLVQSIAKFAGGLAIATGGMAALKLGLDMIRSLADPIVLAFLPLVWVFEKLSGMHTGIITWVRELFDNVVVMGHSLTTWFDVLVVRDQWALEVLKSHWLDFAVFMTKTWYTLLDPLAQMLPDIFGPVAGVVQGIYRTFLGMSDKSKENLRYYMLKEQFLYRWDSQRQAKRAEQGLTPDLLGKRAGGGGAGKLAAQVTGSEAIWGYQRISEHLGGMWGDTKDDQKRTADNTDEMVRLLCGGVEAVYGR